MSTAACSNRLAPTHAVAVSLPKSRLLSWLLFPKAPSFDRETGMFRKACIFWVVAWMVCLSVGAQGIALAIDPTSSDEIRWVQNVDQALRLARSQQRPILIHFFGDNCPPCKMLDKKAFRDTGLIQAMNQELIAVRINADEDRDVASRYKVNRWPTDVYLYPNGDEIYRNISSQDPVAYTKTIEKVAQKCRDWNLEQRPTSSSSSLATRSSSPSTSLIAKTPLPSTSQPMAESSAGDTSAKPSLASRFGQWTKSLKGNKSKAVGTGATASSTMDPILQEPRIPTAPRGSGDIASTPPNCSTAAELASRLTSEHAKSAAPQTAGSIAPADSKLAGAGPANASANRDLPTHAIPPASTVAPAASSTVRLVSSPKSTPPESSHADSSTSIATPDSDPPAPVATTPVASHSAAKSSTTPTVTVPPATAPTSAASDIAASSTEPVVAIKVAIVKEIQDANAMATPSAPVVPSASRLVDPELALQGFCPVKLHQAARQPAGQSATTAWVPGRPEFAVRHRGRIYHCSSSEARAILLQSPDVWTPVLSGCDLVEYARSGKWVDGDCQFGFVEQHSGRIFLFTSKANYDEFARNCDAYSKMVGDPSRP